MSLVCGVDVGGKRARLCFLDPEDAKHPMMVRFEPPASAYKKLSHVEAARWAANQAPAVWRELDPLVVWFEQPFGGNPRANFQLSLMCGALLSGLSRECPVEFIGAGEARKLVGLRGNAAKSEIIGWATIDTDADFEYDCHDADALVIARAILAHGSSKERTAA
jgi:hypothetical protein